MRLSRPRPLTTRPRVSVVVPCYKYGAYLPACIASITSQPGVEVDVLIVDDASPDDSADVARALAAADPRVRVLVHGTNLRHIATYNEGLSMVDGEYVVLLSADDLLAPGSLARAVALMEANPSVGLTYGTTPYFSQQPPAPRNQVLGWIVYDGFDWLGTVAHGGHNLVTNPEVVMRREVLTAQGMYDPALPHAGDMELWLRTALTWDIGRLVGPYQAYYRKHGANMQQVQFGGVLDDMAGRRDAFDAVFERHAPRFAPGRPVAALHVAARRALASDAVELACRALDQGVAGAVDLAATYQVFAVETWPAVAGTHGWRRLQHRLDRRSVEAAGPSPREAAAEYLCVLRDKVRWRWWRAFGV